VTLVFVPLSEAAEINPRAPKLSADTTVSFLPMADVSDAGLTHVTSFRRYDEVKTGFTGFQDKDILVAKVTPCFENNKIAQADLPTACGFGSTEFHVVRSRENADNRYLFHFLRQDWVRYEGGRRMTGSGGQRRVPKGFLEELQIPLPPLPEQRRIAGILDQADALRRLRHLSLSRLSDLGQAIFYEMFGDPAQNPKKFEMRPLRDTASKFSDGPFGSNLKSAHYVEVGVRVIRLQNIGVGEFVDKDQAYISTSHFASIKKHECLPGDIIVGTLGDPNLRACIQPEWLGQALNKADCVQIRVNQAVANNEYLCALLNIPSVERMAHDLVHGQTRARISMGRLRDLQVPIAPKDQQDRFAEVIAKLKQEVQSAGDAWKQSDSLFTSLQHRAFRGEL